MNELPTSHWQQWRILIAGLLGIPVMLLMDSPVGDALFVHGQALATLLVFLVYMVAYKKSTRRVRQVMLIGLVVGMSGEVFFSLIMGMYHYRLGNVPLWVAFGHGLIFAYVFRMAHKDWLKSNQQVIQQALLAFAILYSLFWLWWANDWYGLLCTVVFIAILFTAKKSRLFFLIMFAVVCYIEQVGTAVQCWYWPATLLNQPGWLPSGNPPSGIGVFYFLFDAAVLWTYLYLLHPKTRHRYRAMILNRS